MIRTLCITLVLMLCVTTGRAEPYWVAYEGNDFPENEGWMRLWYDGFAERSIEESVLVIDSLHDIAVADFYRLNMNGSLDPEPGEVFVLQWRLQVDQVIGLDDPGISVFSDERWTVGFNFSETTVYSGFEPGVSAAFEPGIFHEFELRSHNMQDYELFIDDELAIVGSFWLSLSASRVGWGDTVQGAASLSRWDYVRFGVVPEPPSVILLLCVAIVCCGVGRN